MKTVPFDQLEVNASIPELQLAGPTRADCERFMEACEDFHPIHSDVDYARAAGMPDIVVPGLLLLAHVGRCLTNWAPRMNVREFGGRFLAQCYPGEMLRIGGTVVEKIVAGTERRVRIDLRVYDEDLVIKVRGNAIVAFP